MDLRHRILIALTLIVAVAALTLSACAEQKHTDTDADPILLSWNDGPVKDAIVDFVSAVTDSNSADYVEPQDRIAVFDNDGTLWAEQPVYSQLLFVIDRVKAMAADHPEWRDDPQLRAILEDDRDALAEVSLHDLLRVVLLTHSGVTIDEFAGHVKDWLATSRHPRFDQPFTQMVYQPMLELLDYLRAHEFKTFIVSGGGVDFMRVFSQDVYGIPPEQVIGSSGQTQFELRDGQAVLFKLPELDFVDDKEGKPVGIHRCIGKRPIAAFGNSDGDLQMLQYTAGGDGRRLMALVHHDDETREWAYDRASSIGHLDKALDEAEARGWTVISMQSDWSRIFPFEN